MAVDTRVVMPEDLTELRNQLQPMFDVEPEKRLTDAALTRFLKAFERVDAATRAVRRYVEWRNEFGVDQIVQDIDGIRAELESGKSVILKNRDRSGRPVLVITVKLHNVFDRDITALTNFIVYSLETLSRLCDETSIDNICVVYDMKDFTMKCMDYEAVKKLIWLLSHFYPERLGVCLVLNFPLIFWGCWLIIRRWLNEVTANKVIFISNKEELSQYLDLDILPRPMFT